MAMLNSIRDPYVNMLWARPKRFGYIFFPQGLGRPAQCHHLCRPAHHAGSDWCRMRFHRGRCGAPQTPSWLLLGKSQSRQGDPDPQPPAPAGNEKLTQQLLRSGHCRWVFRKNHNRPAARVFPVVRSFEPRTWNPRKFVADAELAPKANICEAQGKSADPGATNFPNNLNLCQRSARSPVSLKQKPVARPPRGPPGEEHSKFDALSPDAAGGPPIRLLRDRSESILSEPRGAGQKFSSPNLAPRHFQLAAPEPCFFAKSFLFFLKTGRNSRPSDTEGFFYRSGGAGCPCFQTKSGSGAWACLLFPRQRSYCRAPGQQRRAKAPPFKSPP